MFFLLPLSLTLGVYVLAAIGPALYLMRTVYRMDSVEKEPKDLLMKLVLSGVYSALAAIVLEIIGQYVLAYSVPNADSPVYIILLAFLVVAVAEEGAKFFFLYRRSWNHPAFNYRFDGIVYSAFVSLGFAAFENVKYVMTYGLSVALPRAILSIPGHLGFAIVFGYFYGRAKQAEMRGDETVKKHSLLAGYLMAVFLHGFYDACAMMQTNLSMVLFVLFVVLMYIYIIRLIKNEAATDEPIGDNQNRYF